MDSSILELVNGIINRKKARFDRRMAQFSLFIVISFALWFLLKLSHEYTTDIKYPIQLVNPPAGKMLINDKPHSLLVKVKAHGYTLLRYKAKALLSPVKLNISSYFPVGKSTSNYYMLTRGTRLNIASQIGGDLDVVDVSTDSLFFQMTEVMEKMVPITPVTRVSFAKQHMLSGDIIVEPYLTKITGPKTILDTIIQIKTEPLVASMLLSTQTHNVRLQSVPHAIISDKSANITIPVSRFTEITIDVPISVANIPDSLSLVTLPSKVVVTCNVPVDKYFMLKSKLFKVVCNFNDRDKIVNGKIKLNLIESPSYVSRVKFYPEYIDYFIRK